MDFEKDQLDEAFAHLPQPVQDFIMSDEVSGVVNSIAASHGVPESHGEWFALQVFALGVGVNSLESLESELRSRFGWDDVQIAGVVVDLHNQILGRCRELSGLSNDAEDQEKDELDPDEVLYSSANTEITRTTIRQDDKTYPLSSLENAMVIVLPHAWGTIAFGSILILAGLILIATFNTCAVVGALVLLFFGAWMLYLEFTNRHYYVWVQFESGEKDMLGDGGNEARATSIWSTLDSARRALAS